MALDKTASDDVPNSKYSEAAPEGKVSAAAPKTPPNTTTGPLKHISFSTVIYVLIAGWFLNSFYHIYSLWNPAQCVPGKDIRCIESLFSETDRVDVYVYTSTSNKKALTKQRFGDLDLLWNVSNISIGEHAESNVTVPLPTGVRNNGSLTAHVYVVRTGMSPDPSTHKKSHHHAQEGFHHLYADLLYAHGPLTRHQPAIARNRTMLLGTEGGGDDEVGGVSDGDAPNASVYSNAHMLANTAIITGLTSGVSPNVLTAGARYGVLAYGASSARGFVDDVRTALLSDGGSVEDVIPLAAYGPPITHWKGKLDINLVQDFSAYHINLQGWPPGLFVEYSKARAQPINRFYKIHPTHNKYVPWLEVDEFSLLSKFLLPLSTNTSNPDPPLVINFNPVSRTRFQVTKQMEISTLLMQEFGFSEYDLDDVKQLVAGTSLKMLALTYVISMMHMVFDYLAFKNDVGFFRARKDYTGISGRTLLSSFVCSVVICLYLMDNDYTSRIVLGSVVVGTLIDGWKVWKVLKPVVHFEYGLPWVRAADRGTRTKGEEETGDIDAIGFKWLSRVMYPLVLMYGVYSLYTEAHKSWWSWCIHSLANGVYTFGFIMMTPQLFVNYKLKSVAHLPWKVFMYKAFNTFIDDVFSFIMVMPTAHRIACLRDDVVFFVYLYQRYLYPVDMKRANEFGIAYEEEDDDANAPAPADTAAETHAKGASDAAADKRD